MHKNCRKKRNIFSLFLAGALLLSLLSCGGSAPATSTAGGFTFTDDLNRDVTVFSPRHLISGRRHGLRRPR